MVVANIKKLTREQIIENARQIRDEVAKVAIETEKRGNISDEIVKKLCEAGFFSAMTPSEFGGHEMPLDVVFDICDYIGQGCVSTAWVTCLVSVHNWMVGLFPWEAQREVFADNNYNLVSATFSPKGKAIKTQGGYILTGRWPFITGVKHDSWVIVGGMYLPNSPDEKPVPKVFLLPQKEVEILDTWYVSGMKGTGSNDIQINEVFVPEYRVVNLIDLLNGNSPGSKVLKSTNFQWCVAPVTALSGTAPAIGAAKRVIQIYKDKLHSFLDKNVEVRQTALVRLSDIMVRLETVELLMRDSIKDMILKTETRSLTLNDRAKYRVQCTLAVKECKSIINEVLDVMGSRSHYLTEELQRFARDIAMIYSHIMLDFDGANEVYGKLQLGLPHNTPII
ncbi:acyl-CoA dehydrogenase family protein [Nostoc sp. XA010]|uniref:acyl-CoA dehydrogenase family protein n=1 Tax=Nostoc sp. XA010 TaxID=2780407 RepID=UPI001E2BD794|nr:acyl-CoA dehydrogenase family protein [Nostoc sp. XA010]MCC5661243.1 acyl-CoA dehydrogenase family protein [Nostoc sp. XA010]